MTNLAHRVRDAFVARYGCAPRLFWAPGRVNLIGEHTDYNGGFVMPAAIDLGTVAAVAPRGDGRLRLASLDLPGELDAPLAGLRPHGDWTDYAAGVTVQLGGGGGADLLFGSDVPLGGGLSSSAALEVATALALGLPANLATARLCQQAENEFAGLRCGIMDQYASCCGMEDHALQLDCLHLTCQPVPIPASAVLVIANTMVKHALAAGEYNERRGACESAARKLGVATLREAQASDHPSFTDLERRCARHVAAENERVAAFAAALRAQRLTEAGGLLYASHASLRDDYRVSCAELDLMVELARATPGVFGARMTGGGFGGCTVNLVAAPAAAEAVASLQERYAAATGVRPAITVRRASAGAREIFL